MLLRRPQSAAWHSFALLFALVLPPAVFAQPAFLVKDINTTTPSASSSSIRPDDYIFGKRDFVEHGGRLLFAATDGILGRQMWVSDATPAGTTLVEYLPDSF